MKKYGLTRRPTTLPQTLGRIIGGILKVMVVPVLVVGFVALSGEITKAVWNVLVSPLFHLQELSFWQGVALNVVLAVVGGLLEKMRPTVIAKSA